MLETFTISTFNENDIFKIYYEEQYAEVTLVKISESKFKNPNAVRQAFSLLFKGKKEILFQQGTYKMMHEKTGSFDLFIVPVVAPYGQEEVSHFYEAVFS